VEDEGEFGRIVSLQAANLLDYLAESFQEQTDRFLTGLVNIEDSKQWFEDCFLMTAGTAVDRWCRWWKERVVEGDPVRMASSVDSPQLHRWMTMVLEELQDSELGEAWHLFCLRELASAGWVDPVEILKEVREKEPNERIRNEIDRTVKILERDLITVRERKDPAVFAEYQQLQSICFGDQDTVSRLLNAERKRHPGISDKEACRRAIKRWKSTNR
jgi:hypothetical protein